MKYIALTDIHLGQNGVDKKGHYSLLAPRCIGERYQKLQRCIHSFTDGDPWTLVLGGDILDLSLARMDTCMEEFLWLLGHLQPTECFYVIGNHDHHVHVMHKEYWEIIYPLMSKDGVQPPFYQPTSMIGNRSDILWKFAEGTKRKTLKIAYPSICIGHKMNGANILITHGHLAGGLYSITSDILRPYQKRYDRETISTTVNLPIIEFIYWLLGQAGGGFGVDGIIEAVYTDLQKGDDSLIAELISRAVDVLLPKGLIRGIPDSWERNLVKWGARKMVKGFVTPKKPLTSSDRHRKSFPAYEEVKKWVEEVYPPPLYIQSVIHGHTHVAAQFEHRADLRNSSGVIVHQEHLVTYTNPGSWLVEPGHDNPDTCVVLIDNDDKFSRPIVKLERIG